ncbi:EamA family transporter RarD [Bacillus weihaiensis]|uniref:Transporter n=1 Tax=Bacillus weihaiensis TaxID=1547283 RepID=A0A1L3MQX0_9BACI|nr:EamA family transporter RarD [Bacillus weihaiensis]APH04737.1 transporter [Bacillus weihaiensis]
MLNNKENSTYKKGILYTASSYFLWGILPLYWKLIGNVASEEILAHRIFWSFIFMIVILTTTREILNIRVVTTELLKKPKLLLMLIISSVLISINWFVYIWAVNHNQMIEASLGYYINPLISVLLGLVFFKEKINLLQKISFIIAALGVIYMTTRYGEIPLIAITLAVSFGLYGLTKKITKLSSAMGLTLETLMVTPIAIFYLVYLGQTGNMEFMNFNLETNLLLIGAGAATAIPLLLFATGAQKIPLYMVGILQYIAPTITLMIGIVIYSEPFTTTEVVTFSCIWSALFLFTMSHSKLYKKIELKHTKRKSIEF